MPEQAPHAVLVVPRGAGRQRASDACSAASRRSGSAPVAPPDAGGRRHARRSGARRPQRRQGRRHRARLQPRARRQRVRLRAAARDDQRARGGRSRRAAGQVGGDGRRLGAPGRALRPRPRPGGAVRARTCRRRRCRSTTRREPRRPGGGRRASPAAGRSGSGAARIRDAHQRPRPGHLPPRPGDPGGVLAVRRRRAGQLRRAAARAGR